MKFSFSLVPSFPMTSYGDIVAEAEARGYDLAWTPDQGFMQDPFVAVSYLMTRTRFMSLGVGITNPYQRHPIQIARAAVTLADLRPGGFILGLGAGKNVVSATGSAHPKASSSRPSPPLWPCLVTCSMASA